MRTCRQRLSYYFVGIISFRESCLLINYICYLIFHLPSLVISQIIWSWLLHFTIQVILPEYQIFTEQLASDLIRKLNYLFEDTDFLITIVILGIEPDTSGLAVVYANR